MAATKTGDTYTWGWGDYGQLGLGSTENAAVPMIIERMKGKNVRALAAGYLNTAFPTLTLSNTE